MWSELLVAVALMLVIEGILPFLGPRYFKALLRTLAEADEGALRWSGLLSMLAGLALLYLVR